MTGLYDLKLVWLSVAVAVLASFTALDLAGRVSAPGGRRTALWLMGGAFAMGTGIWSMHFIGMLAFRLPVPVAYDATLTLLSLAIAIVVSAFALFAMRRTSLDIGTVAGSATLMGLGICSMHYTGMAAMRMSPPIRYDPLLFVASVAIAIAASLAALWIAFHLKQRYTRLAVLGKLGSAVVMGLAITGMHYTGMAAAQFVPGSICRALDSTGGMNSAVLAVLVGTATLGILAAALGLSAMDAHFAQRNAELALSLQQANERLTARTADLARINDDLEQFAFIASHDLQEPLRTTANFALLLRDRYHDRLDDDGREFIGYVVSGVTHMRRLIDGMLLYSRAGVRPGLDARADCGQIVSEALRDLRAAIEESGAIIARGELPAVRADAGQVEQLFLNLIGNAIKFRSAAPLRITIGAVREGDMWQFSVQDNGIGIDPAYADKIFEMFERLHGAGRYPGTGIGLALCRKIVLNANGRIWVESAEGQGALFRFTLPAA
jgi:NO-binding membrane sensor protein with MHYT domain